MFAPACGRLLFPFVFASLCARSLPFRFNSAEQHLRALSLSFSLPLCRLFLSLSPFFPSPFAHRCHAFSLPIVSLARARACRYRYGLFRRYRARIWFIARFVITISGNSRACAAGAHAACCTRYIEATQWTLAIHWGRGKRRRAKGDRVGSHARCIVRPRKEGKQAKKKKKKEKKKEYVRYRSDRSSRFVGSCASTRGSTNVCQVSWGKCDLNFVATNETPETYLHCLSLYLDKCYLKLIRRLISEKLILRVTREMYKDRERSITDRDTNFAIVKDRKKRGEEVSKMYICTSVQ